MHNITPLNGLGVTEIINSNVTVAPGATPGLEISLLPMRQEVYESNEQLPLIGSAAVRLGQTDHDIQGFNYDRRRWQANFSDTYKNPGLVGEYVLQTTDALQDSSFYSGFGDDDDCELVDVVPIGICQWEPRVKHGQYFIHHESRYLLSDGMVTHELINSSFDYSADIIALDYNFKAYSPIEIATYRRRNGLMPLSYLKFYNVSEFDAEPTRHYEFLNNGAGLSLNHDPFISVGSLDSSYYLGASNPITMAKHCLEQLGTSDGEANQQYHTKLFPLESIILYTYDASTLTEWTEVSNLNEYSDIHNVYEVDRDLGVIYFARYKEAETRLSFLYADGDTELYLNDTTDFLDKGRILVDGNTLTYNGKDSTKLFNVAGVISSDIPADTQVVAIQSGAAPGSGLYIAASYRTSLRISYEIDGTTDLHQITSLNVHPSKNQYPSGIVHFSIAELVVDELILTCDATPLGADTYGPISFGSDYTLLTVQATNEAGVPVPGAEVTFSQLQTNFVGLLNGSASEVSGITNQDGEVKTTYVAGSGTESLETYSDVVTSGTTSSITLSGDFSFVNQEEAYLFACLKDDPAIGSVGVFAEVTAYNGFGGLPGAISHIETGNIIVNGITSTLPLGVRYGNDVFKGGKVYVKDAALVEHEAEVVYYRNGILYLDRSLTLSGGPVSLRALGENWVEFDPSDLTGSRKAVLYTYDTDARHPLTDALGANMPLFPSSISYDSIADETTFTYAANLPVPDKTDPENNLCSYWFGMGISVSFQATADNIVTGEVVTSNTITLQLSLSDAMKGVALVDSSSVPYGFRIHENVDESSSALDGATFVTINPISGSYSGSTASISDPFGSITTLLSV